MALDGIVTSATVFELTSYIGARITKIYQPAPSNLVFTIRGQKGQARLLLSANPAYPRVHFTEQSFQNPLEAPMFCMLMRKHCEGGIIESIKQVGRERIIHMDISRRDELGDLSAKRIIIEIMGRHSNIILTDLATGTIHDGIHHVTPAISRHRIILPGSLYVSPPEQDKSDPFAVQSKEQFELLFAQNSSNQEGTEEDHKKLVRLFSGISPLLAKEIVYRSNGQPDIWDGFHTVMSKAANNQLEPSVTTDPQSGKTYFSIVPLQHISQEHRIFGTISECLEFYYGDKAERDTVKQRASDLIKFVTNEKAKNENKIGKLNESAKEAQDAEKLRILGELLTAYMHEMNKGDNEITVINFYDEQQTPITISLDASLSPSENAQRYFRRYTKYKNSLTYVNEQLEIANVEIVYLESILQQLESASVGDIDEIREELVAEGYLREKSKRGPKKKKTNKPTLLCYTSSEGIPIFVGKNNIQNEYLTNRLASVSDTWLHTKDIPGSHVVIRSSAYNDATLEEAAMLAAHYSQARGSSMVPVDYTAIRHVRKPNGAKPGFVIYDQQKTVFITPDEDKIKRLPNEIK